MDQEAWIFSRPWRHRSCRGPMDLAGENPDAWILRRARVLSRILTVMDFAEILPYGSGRAYRDIDLASASRRGSETSIYCDKFRPHVKRKHRHWLLCRIPMRFVAVAAMTSWTSPHTLFGVACRCNLSFRLCVGPRIFTSFWWILWTMGLQLFIQPTQLWTQLRFVF